MRNLLICEVALNKSVIHFSFCLLLLVSPFVQAGQKSVTAQPASSTAFETLVFEGYKKQYQGEKWLLLLWSVDCPPCMKELAIVQKLQQKKAALSIVIINVDTHEGSEQERDRIIAHFNLSPQTNLHFKDGFEDQSRYVIDPTWYGELPRSYFIDETGKFHGKSGVASKSLLSKWLL